MTREEAIEKLNNLEHSSLAWDEGPIDKERAHGDADEILLAVLRHIGFDDVAQAWCVAERRIGFWYA